MKRLLSLMVAFAMILSMVPNVFATETTEDQLPSDMETIGSVDNPEVLAELGSDSLTLASGDTDGYYYAYTAIGDGTVSAYIESVTASVGDENETEIVTASTEEETVTAAVALTNKTTSATGTEVAVSEGDIVLIQVTSSAAADITWYGTFTYYAGHETNPINNWEWNEAGTEATLTATVPAGATYYFAAYVSGAELYINDELQGTVNGSRWMPATFTVTNEGEEAAEYSLKLAYPVGSQMNPEVTTLGWVDVTLAEGNTDGHYYTYVAEGTGTVTAYIGSITEGVTGDIILTNNSTYAQRSLSADGVDNNGLEVTLDVNEGDVVTIQVVALPDENWVYPAAEITWVANFAYTPGSENNPIDLTTAWTWNETNTEATATVTVPVGTTYYMSYGVGGMLLSVNGGEAVELESNPMLRGGAIFTLVNEGEAEAEYTLTISYPAGHQMNPETSYLGWTDVSLAEGDYDGYYYTYVAEGTGSITACISSITEGVTGDIILYNNNTYAQRSLSANGVDNNGLEVTLDVNEGDVITIQVMALPDENYVYPAAEITWIANFTATPGSEANPLIPEWTWNEAYTEATTTVTVEAGATVYYAVYNAGGMKLVINDGEPTTLVATGMGRGPAVFSITNDGEAAAEYSLKIYWPVGAYSNPAALVMGENTATVEEGSQGYYYTWTATEAGTLTIEMPSGMDWTYVINNMTTYVYGDTQYSDSDPVVNPGTIEVAAGDEIQIMVNTYDPANPWTAPAGKLPFTASFENAAPIVITSQPVDYVGMVGDTATFTVVAEGEGLTYQWYFYDTAASEWKKSSGNTSATISVEFKAYRNNQQYRCEITDAIGNTITTDIAKLVAKAVDLVIITQPVSYVGSVNDEVSFVVEATGNGLTYQWYFSTDSGATWEKSGSPGFATNNLQPILRTYRDGYMYYCQITDVLGNTVDSDVVSMTVKSSDVIIVAQPTDVENAVLGELYYYTVEATGDNLTYRWEVSSDGGETWSESWNQGYNTATLGVRMNANRDGNLYRCKITSGLKTVAYTDSVSLNLQEPSAKIVSQSGNVAVIANQTATFTVTAEGTDLTYLWYRSNDKGTTWIQTYLTGYNTNTLSFVANTNRAAMYMCKVTDGSGTVVWSEPVKLQILSAELQILTQPVSINCASGETATFTVEAQGDTLKYQWYASADGGETWTMSYLTGYNTAEFSFVVNATRAAKLYKCIITDVAGNTVETDPVSVTIE